MQRGIIAKLMVLVSLAVIGVYIVSCEASVPEVPDMIYKQYVSAIKKGDYNSAWELMSTDFKTQYASQLESVRKMSSGMSTARRPAGGAPMEMEDDGLENLAAMLALSAEELTKITPQEFFVKSMSSLGEEGIADLVNYEYWQKKVHKTTAVIAVRHLQTERWVKKINLVLEDNKWKIDSIME